MVNHFTYSLLVNFFLRSCLSSCGLFEEVEVINDRHPVFLNCLELISFRSSSIGIHFIVLVLLLVFEVFKRGSLASKVVNMLLVAISFCDMLNNGVV